MMRYLLAVLMLCFAGCHVDSVFDSAADVKPTAPGQGRFVQSHDSRTTPTPRPADTYNIRPVIMLALGDGGDLAGDHPLGGGLSEDPFDAPPTAVPPAPHKVATVPGAATQPAPAATQPARPPVRRHTDFGNITINMPVTIRPNLDPPPELELHDATAAAGKTPESPGGPADVDGAGVHLPGSTVGGVPPSSTGRHGSTVLLVCLYIACGLAIVIGAGSLLLKACGASIAKVFPPALVLEDLLPVLPVVTSFALIAGGCIGVWLVDLFGMWIFVGLGVGVAGYALETWLFHRKVTGAATGSSSPAPLTPLAPSA